MNDKTQYERVRFWLGSQSTLLQGMLRLTAVSCSSPRLEGRIMRYELTDDMLPNKEVGLNIAWPRAGPQQSTDYDRIFDDMAAESRMFELADERP